MNQKYIMIFSDFPLFSCGPWWSGRSVIFRRMIDTEELGSVSYLFSDKTGTLTANEMVFKKLHLGSATITCNFWDEVRLGVAKLVLAVEAMTLCHKVTPMQRKEQENCD